MRSAMLTGLSSAALLVALGVTPALAQEPAAPGAGDVPVVVGTPAGDQAEAEVLAANPFDAETVDPTDPFGDLAVDLTANADAMLAFDQTLSEEQKLELQNRCSIITDGENGDRYGDEAISFCSTWATVQAGEEGNLPLGQAEAAAADPAASGHAPLVSANRPAPEPQQNPAAAAPGADIAAAAGMDAPAGGDEQARRVAEVPGADAAAGAAEEAAEVRAHAGADAAAGVTPGAGVAGNAEADAAGEAAPGMGGRLDQLAAKPLTAADIDPVDPFGTIDVEDLAADIRTNPDAMMAWQQTLTEEQKLELTNRCDVIVEAEGFDQDSQAFCDTWAIVAAGEAGDIPEAVPGVATPPAN